MKRLPPWIKIRLVCNEKRREIEKFLADIRLNTVCESANCPNKHECFGRGTATIMILGNICTRNCGFCAVQSGTPAPIDRDEPRRVFELAKKLGLRHVVITSVTRDDVENGGADIFAETILRMRSMPNTTVEVLTPDFQGRRISLETVLMARPDIFNHNLETVKRLQPLVRPQAGYDRSLDVLRAASEFSPGIRVKSGLMAGLGETDAELFEAMRDILKTGCGYLTIGQYLAPSRDHQPAARYVHPELFDKYKDKAYALGFEMVESGPFVRSSYHAERMMSGKKANASENMK